MILQLMRHYRLDVAVISFGAYVFGRVMTGGVKLLDVPTGLAISLISFNYIYSFNSIEDRDIDRINKPERPLPAGKLPVAIARRYVAILLVLSIVYPFLVYANVINLALFLTLPLLGWAYSASPLRLKTKILPALISIALMYITPIAIGLTYRLNALKPAHAVVLGYIFLFCLSIVPLKDIEDIHGDQLHGSNNWMATLGFSRLLTFSLIGLAASILFVLLTGLGLVTPLLVSLSGSTAALIIAFWVFQLPRERLYRSVLILIALLGLVFCLYSLFTGGSL